MPNYELKKTASDAADSVKQAAAGAADTLHAAKDQARDYAEHGLEYAEDYSGQLAEFVKREPWMAMAGALSLAMRRPSCCGAYRGIDPAFGSFTLRA